MPVVEGVHDGRSVVARLVIAHPDDIRLESPISARGLIDTGATVTAVSRDIAETLKLRPEGKRTITNTHGQARSTQYRFRVGLITAAGNGRLGAASLPYLLDDLVFGIDIIAGASFDVLIGMDILSLGDLCVRRNRTWTFQL